MLGKYDYIVIADKFKRLINIYEYRIEIQSFVKHIDFVRGNINSI